jgi:hypothetical protein
VICCADHKKSGSSTLNALPENGRRQRSVAAVNKIGATVEMLKGAFGLLFIHEEYIVQSD